jgi:hypothetical protein
VVLEADFFVVVMETITEGVLGMELANLAMVTLGMWGAVEAEEK